jgi:cysteinyl-tRNA synthetase
LERLDGFLGALVSSPNGISPSELGKNFDLAMADDFNTAATIGYLYDAFVLANKLLDDPKILRKPDQQKILAAIAHDARRVGKVLGILRAVPKEFLLARRTRQCAQRGIDSNVVEAQITERVAARAGKDFTRADAIRAQLKDLGVELMDSGGGTTWRVVG